MTITYQELLYEVRRALEAQDVSSAGLESRLLVCFAAGKNRDQLARDMRVHIDAGREEAVRALLARRLDGEPLAHILGEWAFMGHAFEITPDTLIPRADTELLCETAIAAMPQGGRMLDLCCGSGCIGLAALCEREDINAVLVELMQPALAVAKRNARRLGVSGRALFICDDARCPIPEAFGLFDVIVSNPPYIPSADIATLDRSVRDFEPRIALDGGGDGLDFYRAYAENLKRALAPGGLVALEVGIGQADDVAKLFSEHGWTQVEKLVDLGGVERVVKMRLA